MCSKKVAKLKVILVTPRIIDVKSKPVVGCAHTTKKKYKNNIALKREQSCVALEGTNKGLSQFCFRIFRWNKSGRGSHRHVILLGFYFFYVH